MKTIIRTKPTWKLRPCRVYCIGRGIWSTRAGYRLWEPL